MTKPKRLGELKGKASKLKRADVINIRRVAAEGTQSVRQIASFYGVGAETIRRVLRRETWNEVQDSTYVENPEQLALDSAASFARLQKLMEAAKEQPAKIKDIYDGLEEAE